MVVMKMKLLFTDNLSRSYSESDLKKKAELKRSSAFSVNDYLHFGLFF